jgi:hypothetical protein
MAAIRSHQRELLARVRRVYDRLGIGDRTAIEFFNGGHTIHAQGTFEFLQRQMD